MAAGDIAKYSDVPQIVKRGNRNTNKTVATTEFSIIRVDAIPMLTGHAYRIWSPRIRIGFATTTDRVNMRIRLNAAGVATTASTIIARAELGHLNTTYVEGMRYSAVDETVSVLLTGIQYAGSSAATLNADEGGVELLIQDLGLDPGDSGVDL